MYIGYIFTNPPNLTLIRRFDPSLTSDDLELVMIYTDSESVKKVSNLFRYFLTTFQSIWEKKIFDPIYSNFQSLVYQTQWSIFEIFFLHHNKFSKTYILDHSEVCQRLK